MYLSELADLTSALPLLLSIRTLASQCMQVCLHTGSCLKDLHCRLPLPFPPPGILMREESLARLPEEVRVQPLASVGAVSCLSSHLIIEDMCLAPPLGTAPARPRSLSLSHGGCRNGSCVCVCVCVCLCACPCESMTHIFKQRCGHKGRSKYVHVLYMCVCVCVCVCVFV